MLIGLLILALCLFLVWSTTDDSDRIMCFVEELAPHTTASYVSSDPIAIHIVAGLHAARLIARR